MKPIPGRAAPQPRPTDFLGNAFLFSLRVGMLLFMAGCCSLKTGTAVDRVPHASLPALVQNRI